MSDFPEIPADSRGAPPENPPSRPEPPRRPYSSPRLEVLGDVAAITLGSPGTFLESGQEPTPSKA